jgi:hypothetical protein
MRCAGKRNASGTAKKDRAHALDRENRDAKGGKNGNHSHVRGGKAENYRNFGSSLAGWRRSEEEKLGRMNSPQLRWRFVGGWWERNDREHRILPLRTSLAGGGSLIVEVRRGL